jgi:flagellar protein FlbT
MQQDEADTPAKRIYFPVMMMYLSPQASNDFYEEFVLRMTEFMNVLSNPEALSECVTISKDVMAGEYYKALLRCRKLITYEAERLSGGPAPSSAED